MTLGALATLSFVLLLWQWIAALRFPLHQRAADLSYTPAVTLLKPLKGTDEFTEDCLRSWFKQDYPSEMQILFAVDDVSDPVCLVVTKLLAEFPKVDAQLIICPDRLGANAKVSKLTQVEPLIKHEVIVISDADVRVVPDLLINAVQSLRDGKVGLVNCFYRLANASNAAMRWEAIATNADFWSQVLQSRSLKPLDFALGAVMATRRKQLTEIGGFRALVDCLADDYQLGHRIAKQGHRIELCSVPVDCWSASMSWGSVWRHQLRWARTIRVCQPLPYFFSILGNSTLWSVAWMAVSASLGSCVLGGILLTMRVIVGVNLQRRLARSRFEISDFWLVPTKDLLQAFIWAGAFLGSRIEWRGEWYRLRSDGSLQRS